ncbi:MAG: hypothetical protein E4H17_03365, partial [Gemmatimonadales bacterium]
MIRAITRACRTRRLATAAWVCGALLASPVAAAPGEQAMAAYLAGYRTQVAYHAVRLADGAVLASRDAETPLPPASVQKLVSSAVALTVLGEPFHFTTRLAVLADDLLLVGDGDPVLGDPVLAAERGGSIYDSFDAWADQLKAGGVTGIKGNLIV